MYLITYLNYVFDCNIVLSKGQVFTTQSLPSPAQTGNTRARGNGRIRVLMEAAVLPMQHQHLVVVVDLLGGPVGREHRFQQRVGRPTATVAGMRPRRMATR